MPTFATLELYQTVVLLGNYVFVLFTVFYEQRGKPKNYSFDH